MIIDGKKVGNEKDVWNGGVNRRGYKEVSENEGEGSGKKR